MARLAYLLTCIVTQSVFCKDCLINVPEEYAWETQLKKDLKCDFKMIGLPPRNISTVNIRFIMKSFQFDSNEEVFTIHSWMFITWTDERLKWDPQNYGGINETEVKSPNIWMPTFRLFNSADAYDFDRFFYVRCHLKSSGVVLCVPRIEHAITCSVNLTNWPYDRQKCSIIYGAWTPHHGRINLTFNSRAIRMLGAEYGAEWTVVDYEQEENHDSDQQLKMIFTLDREAMSLAAIVIYPSLILSTLTVVSLFLDVRRSSRFYLICFSVFSHFYFLSELVQDIPKESAASPTILLYYRGSLIVTLVSFLLTFFLGLIAKKDTPPHSLIMSVNNFVFKSYGKYAIYPKWDIESVAIVEDDKSGGWTNIANIINSLCIIIIVIVYMCMYFAFMPQPYPIIM